MCTERMDLFFFCTLSTNHCIGFPDLAQLNLWHGEFQLCGDLELYFCLPQGCLIGYLILYFSWPRLFTCCFYQNYLACYLTFGGMCSWRRVAVARVFALVVRCWVMRLLLYSRVGKNRDTRRRTPAGAGADRTADHLTVLFSQKVLAVRKANCIYRPVSKRNIFIQCQLALLFS